MKGNEPEAMEKKRGRKEKEKKNANGGGGGLIESTGKRRGTTRVFAGVVGCELEV